MSVNFDFSEDPTGRLGSALVPSSRGGGIEVTTDVVKVAFGEPALFAAEIPRSSIREASRMPDLKGGIKGSTRGIHGRSGRWLLNRSSRDLVRLKIDPTVEAKMSLARLDVPDSGSRLGRWVQSRVLRDRTVKLRELTIGVVEPDTFLAALKS